MACVFIKYCKDTNSFILLKKSVIFSCATSTLKFPEGDVRTQAGVQTLAPVMAICRALKGRQTNQQEALLPRFLLPGFGKDAGGDVKGEPGPAEEAVGGGTFEALHRRCAGHEGETEGEGYVFLYLPVGFQLYLVAEGHVHVDVAQSGAHGQIVVVDADAQVAKGFDGCADEGVLQSGRKAVDEGADVEEVHGTVELVVGAEDGGERMRRLMRKRKKM